MDLSLNDASAYQRPRGIPLFSDGVVYFKKRPFIRIFFIFILLPVASSLAAFFHSHVCAGFFLLAVGLMITCIFSIALASGKSSTNGKTYFRDREPIRYWIDIVILVAAYITISFIGWDI